MFLCLFVYLMMGLFGFLAFGTSTQGNVMMNLQPYLCADNLMVILGFACMAFAVTMAFPLNIFPIRFAVETILFFHWPELNTRVMRLGIAVAAVGSAFGVAVAIPSINVI